MYQTPGHPCLGSCLIRSAQGTGTSPPQWPRKPNGPVEKWIMVLLGDNGVPETIAMDCLDSLTGL